MCMSTYNLQEVSGCIKFFNDLQALVQRCRFSDDSALRWTYTRRIQLELVDDFDARIVLDLEGFRLLPLGVIGKYKECRSISLIDL